MNTFHNRLHPVHMILGLGAIALTVLAPSAPAEAASKAHRYTQV